MHRRCSLLSLLLVLVSCAISHASIFPIQSRDWIPPFQHAEKIFASNQGPIFARHGNSTIGIAVRGTNVTDEMQNWRLVVFFYHIESLEAFNEVGSKIELLACASSQEIEAFPGMTNVRRVVVPVQNGSVQANVEYAVLQNGWTDTQIFACAESVGSAAQRIVEFEGKMVVRNPFGLLPAALYGMLPFSAFLTLGYVVLLVFFFVLLCRHRHQVITLHYNILVVLVMGTAATATCFYAFFRMNETGEPLCCPYPTPYLSSVVLDTLMRTAARLLLVVVCLGYGIVRNSLGRCEVLAVSLLSIAYFVSGIADELTRSAASDAITSETPSTWSFVQLLCNLTFIMWINFALERILKTLADQKQTAKLHMYKSLTYSLAAFVVFFTALTIVALLNRVGVFDWDVEWEWMQLVAWPVLNFVVSAAMCFIWRPTSSSSQFAFSMQLPVTDDAETDDGETSVEMASAVSSRSGMSDDDDFAEDSDEDLEQGKPIMKNGGVSKVASAAGEEQRGEEEDDDEDEDDGI